MTSIKFLLDFVTLYQQAVADSGFRIDVVAKPGEIHTFDITGDEEFMDADRLILEGELAKERDYSPFWETFERIKQETKKDNLNH